MYALSFIYGQKHVHEVEMAEEIAHEAGVHFDKMDVSFISSLAHNSLTDSSIVMDQVNLPTALPTLSCRDATFSS